MPPETKFTFDVVGWGASAGQTVRKLGAPVWEASVMTITTASDPTGTGVDPMRPTWPAIWTSSVSPAPNSWHVASVPEVV
jgi:hypothetical protein